MWFRERGSVNFRGEATNRRSGPLDCQWRERLCWAIPKRRTNNRAKPEFWIGRYRHYNTPQGRGTADEFVQKFEEHVIRTGDA